jgi:hypothetical protein
MRVVKPMLVVKMLGRSDDKGVGRQRLEEDGRMTVAKKKIVAKDGGPKWWGREWGPKNGGQKRWSKKRWSKIVVKRRWSKDVVKKRGRQGLAGQPVKGGGPRPLGWFQSGQKWHSGPSGLSGHIVVLTS